MTKFSLSKVLGSALGFSALVLGGISASALDVDVNAGTTFVITPSTQTPETGYASVGVHTVDGVVQVSLLGNCTVHFDVTLQEPANPLAQPYGLKGDMIITALDGDTLTAAVAGYGIVDPLHTLFLKIHYDVTFTNGTGGLTGATGSGSIDGLAVFADAPGSIDFPGNIGVFPPNADLIAPPSGDLTGKATWLLHGTLSAPTLSAPTLQTLAAVNLKNANLQNADFTDATLSGADLKNANLSGATLVGADLAGADLEGADLSGADFSYANLTGSNLQKANLTDANLLNATTKGATFKGATITGCTDCP